MFEQTGTPYQYTYQNPVRFTDPTGMSAEDGGPIKPPKLATETALIYGLKLGNTDQGYQDFAKSLTSEDLFNVVNSIYDQKMMGYTGAVGQAIYGLDREGNVAVPEGIREKVWAESESLMPNAVKDYWTAQQTGLDPSSLSFTLNPFDQIQWRSTRALAATSNKEALGMIGVTALEAAAGYLGGGRLNFKPNPKIFGANGGYGWFGKEGFNAGGYKLEAMYGNPNAGGGTYFSIKQMKAGGSLFRLDYGPMHKTGNMSIHGTYRFKWLGNQVGSSKTQVPFYQWK